MRWYNVEKQILDCFLLPLNLVEKQIESLGLTLPEVCCNVGEE